MNGFTKEYDINHMIKPKILIIEDEKRIRDIIVDYLEDKYLIDEAENGEEGLKKIGEEEYELIIVDLKLRKMSGFDVCRSIRKFDKEVIIIILSALNDEENKLRGFDCGVDEYVTKPFSPKVLLARVNALINRSNNTSYKKDCIRYGRLVICIDSREVFIDEKEVKFSKKEYDLLLLLLKNKNRVMTRDNIVASVWGHDYVGDGRVVDTNVKMVRKKVGTYSKNIQTIIGVGYMFKECYE